jgi:hypothetical protein
MPLPLPNLDDHDYADLVEMARSLIPTECPEWTDHNPSDTGIMLIELFAWLTELLLYQVNQIPDSSQAVFLQLLNGNANWTKPTNQSLQAATQTTILKLRQRYRAVTAQDYATLVINDWPSSAQAQELSPTNLQIGRVQVFENRNLELEPSKRMETASGHISLVVIPQVSQITTEDLPPMLDPDWLPAIWEFLNGRRLLGIKHHVVAPEYVDIKITANLYPEPGRRIAQVKQDAVKQLQRFFHPLTGGDEGQGWPFGRGVYLSEVYQQLDQVSGIDFVEAVEISLKFNDQPVESVDKYQLVWLQTSEFTLPEIV